MNKKPNCMAQHAEIIAQDLSILSKSRSKESHPIIVGIAGPVAAGKTYFAEALFVRLREKNLRFLHLPFEIWLDTFQEKDPRAPYQSKFYLEKYHSDLLSFYHNQCANVYHTDPGRSQKIRLPESSRAEQQCINSIPRNFLAELPAGEAFSVDPETGIIMREMSAARFDCIVIDGTLVFSSKSIIELFTRRIYIKRPMRKRIAGMKKRFSAGQIHDKSRQIEEYVDYLIKEARFGADDIIRHQIASATEVLTND